MRNIPFRKGHWARQSVLAQSASNPLALLHAASECLREWRDSPEGFNDSVGNKCIPLHLILFHASFLVGMNAGVAWGGRNYPAKYGNKDVDRYSEDYMQMRSLMESIDLDAEAVEHFIAKGEIDKAITYKSAALTQDQERIFRQWARDNFDGLNIADISPNWHSVVQNECYDIEKEWREGGGKEMES